MAGNFLLKESIGAVMTDLTLHYHPLSSHCQKVLIAIDLLGVEVDKRLLNLADPAERDAYLALWPLGKMPLLVERGRAIPETSIIIEHLQRHHSQRGASSFRMMRTRLSTCVCGTVSWTTT
jgi:glutathione S-transferase